MEKNSITAWQRIKLLFKQWFKFIFLWGILGFAVYYLAYETVSRLYLFSSKPEITLTIDWPKAHKKRPYIQPVSLTVDTSKVSLNKPLLRKLQNGWYPSYKGVRFSFFVDPEAPNDWLPQLPEDNNADGYINVEVGVSHKIFKSSYKQHHSRTSMPRRDDMYGLEVFYDTPFKGDPSINVPPGDIGPLFMFYHPKTPVEKGVFVSCSGLKVHDDCSIYDDLSDDVAFRVYIKPANLKYWKILLSTVDHYLQQHFSGQ